MITKVPVEPAEKTLPIQEPPIAVAVGYSARALAQALSDTGFRVIAVDAFGDCDTQEICIRTERLADWGLPGAELSLQPHLWSNQNGAPVESCLPSADVPSAPGGDAPGDQEGGSGGRSSSEGQSMETGGQDSRQGRKAGESEALTGGPGGHSPFPGRGPGRGPGGHSPFSGAGQGHSSFSGGPEDGGPGGHSPDSGGIEGNKGHRPVLVFLGGGCENWPALQTHLVSNKSVRLLGPSTEQLRQLRSIELWREAARFSGIRFPETLPSDIAEPRGRAHSMDSGFGLSEHQFSWLSKSMFSAGGLAVERVPYSGRKPNGANDCVENHMAVLSQSIPGRYFQQEVSGRVLGAVCVVSKQTGFGLNGSGNSIRSQTSVIQAEAKPNVKEQLSFSPVSAFLPDSPLFVRYLGSTEAWQARDWDGPTEFIYRGSWGPIHLTDNQKRQIADTALFLAMETGVVGWLQIDLIEDDSGELWLLEVNPRWSAGMEVLHRSGLENPVLQHFRACEELELGGQEMGWKGHRGSESQRINEPVDQIDQIELMDWPGQIDQIQQTYQGERGTGPREANNGQSQLSGSNASAIQVSIRDSSLPKYFGKAVVYCKEDLLLDNETIGRLQLLARQEFADIPSHDLMEQVIPAGHPLLTVLASIETGGCPAEVRQRLLCKLKTLQIQAFQQHSKNEP